MKKIFYIALLFVLVACVDQHEVEHTHTHRFAKPYTFSKTYPILLDPSEILVDIKVKSPIDMQEPFKIVSNGRYLFVGEMMRGVHVFEITGDFQAIPLCFIEINRMTSFDVADNLLFANNFVDLLAIDVENPLQAEIIHREANYFNNSIHSWHNIPEYYVEGVRMYIIGHRTVFVHGIETDTNPANPDFSEYDKLYENYIVMEIPENSHFNRINTGFANAQGSIFTFGFDGIAQISHTSDGINISQIDISNHNTGQMRNIKYNNGILYVIRSNGFLMLGYHDQNIQSSSFHPWGNITDVVSVKEPANGFVFLREARDGITGAVGNTGIGLPSDAISLINVNDTILALGSNQLTLFRFLYNNDWNFWGLEQVMQYRNISGTSMLRKGDMLIVAGRQGLFFYDISDLTNIKPMQ